MFKNIKQNTIQTILFFLFFMFFLKTESPVVSLTLFIILCAYPVNVFIIILNQEPKLSDKSETGNQWPTIITLMILQILLVCILGLIVWLFIDRKLDVLKSIIY